MLGLGIDAAFFYAGYNLNGISIQYAVICVGLLLIEVGFLYGLRSGWVVCPGP